ncbi:MAG TPA: SRPBCC domain-containing protein [Rugosimonospora sp.]|nr:SRPBCC domain-containing protein [Rugosimonospora sp.]
MTATALVRRVLPAPPLDVYDEWLDPDALADWMCPRPAVPTKIECDPRVGGRYRFDIDEVGQQMTVTGRYLELRRPHLLRFTWHCSTWPPDAPESLVTVTLDAHGGAGTLMTIEHTSLRPDLVDRHEHGWALIAAQLATTLPRPAP